MKSFLRRREDIPNIEKKGNLNMNSEFEVKKIFLPTHLREKRVFKNLRGRIKKTLCALDPH